MPSSSRTPVMQDGSVHTLILTNVLATTPVISWKTEMSGSLLILDGSYAAASAIIYAHYDPDGTFAILQDEGGNNATLTFTTTPGCFDLPADCNGCHYLKILLNAADVTPVYLMTKGG